MAGNETDEISIRPLVSFYLTPESGKVNGQPIHKEKFNVSMEREAHKEFRNFQAHLASFTAFYDIARSKGLGVNPEVNYARIHRVASGVEAFSICMQDAWQHEFPSLLDGTGMLQGK